MSDASSGPKSNTSCRGRSSSGWWASTSRTRRTRCGMTHGPARRFSSGGRSEEHTSELQSLTNLVCRLLLEKKKTKLKRTSGVEILDEGIIVLTVFIPPVVESVRLAGVQVRLVVVSLSCVDTDALY